MSHAIRVSQDLFDKAQVRAETLHRSVSGQIEFWSKIGRIAEENPDLTFQNIHQILIGLGEKKAGQVSPYKFG
jgi:ParD-like antitoxin of type II bacterial toxin-antitoxin system